MLQTAAPYANLAPLPSERQGKNKSWETSNICTEQEQPHALTNRTSSIFKYRVKFNNAKNAELLKENWNV